MSAFKYRKYLASFIAVLLLALSGMASAAAIGEPLAPQVIYDEGGITSIPSTPGNWDVNGSWTNKYRIWIHSGDIGDGEFYGWSEITRIAGATAGAPFTLQFHEHFIDDTSVQNLIEVDGTFKRNQIAEPNDWIMTSDYDRAPVDVNLVDEGVVDGNVIRITRDANSLSWPGPEGANTVSCPWSLFEAVQHLPFADANDIEFDLLDKLTVLKRGMKLAYRGTTTLTISGTPTTLYGFQMLGTGILPYEFWLQSNHRVLMLTTGSRAYILTETTSPVDVNFAPTDDTYVKQDSPTNNYGTNTFLTLRANATKEKRSYLKFTVSGTSGTITSAILRLHADTAMSDTSVYSVTGSWAEGTLTWNTDTLSWGGSALDTISSISASTWYKFDVTSAVTGNATYSFGMSTTQDTTGLDWASKESANDPVLLVTYQP